MWSQRKFSKLTNARCPQCHKKLELRGQGEGQIYVCTTCTFREKAASFNKRFDNNEGKNSKKDVANYMKKMKQESDAPMNSALADALAKLNLK